MVAVDAYPRLSPSAGQLFKHGKHGVAGAGRSVAEEAPAVARIAKNRGFTPDGRSSPVHPPQFLLLNCPELTPPGALFRRYRCDILSDKDDRIFTPDMHGEIAMRSYQLASTILIVMLAASMAGCGGKSEEEKTGDKTENKGFVDSHGVKIGTTAVAPSAKKPISTQYITKDFAAAMVVHPAQVLNSDFVKQIQAEVEKAVGKDKFEAGLKEALGDLGFDPREVKQAIVLVESDMAMALPELMNEFGPRRRSRGRKSYSRPYGKTYEKTPGPRYEKTYERKTPLRRKTSGITPNDDTQFVSATAQPDIDDGPGGRKPPMPSFIVRFTKAPDQAEALKTLEKKVLGPQRREYDWKQEDKERFGAKKFDPDEKTDGDAKSKKDEKKEPKKKTYPAHLNPIKKTHNGHDYHVMGIVSVCFIDDKTLLAAREETLKKMMVAKGVKSPLTDRLSTIGTEHDFILALDATPLLAFIGPLAGGVTEPPELVEALNHLTKLKTIAITAGISGDTMLSLVLQMTEEDAAAGLIKLFQTQLGKGVAAMKENGLRDVEEMAPELKPIITDLINGFAAEAKGKDAVLSLKKPKDFDKLIEQIQPAIAKAREAARRATRKNNLMQIGLAFHNYHNTFTRFPAADSSGDTDRSGKITTGLSWRVHLLPFLEHKNLYDRFKLDEPWDSPHNKKLIAEMPDIYGNVSSSRDNKEGKTQIHIFVGNGAPFGPRSPDQKKVYGPRIRDFTDGTSNTFLAVEAGEDKAEIWTKPGGLPFDPKKNPVELLGTIKGEVFLALWCDGSVRAIKKTIMPKTLKYLIQNSDGNVTPHDPALDAPNDWRRGGGRWDKTKTVWNRD